MNRKLQTSSGSLNINIKILNKILAGKIQQYL